MRRLHRTCSSSKQSFALLMCALQRDERVLVVWSFNLDDIIQTAHDFDEKLIKLVWARRAELTSMSSSAPQSNTGSDAYLTEKPEAGHGINEKEVAAIVKEKETSKRDKDKQKKKKRSCRLGLGYFVSSKEDVEKTAGGPSERPMRLMAPIYCGLACALSFCRSLPIRTYT